MNTQRQVNTGKSNLRSGIPFGGRAFVKNKHKDTILHLLTGAWFWNKIYGKYRKTSDIKEDAGNGGDEIRA